MIGCQVVYEPRLATRAEIRKKEQLGLINQSVNFYGALVFDW